LHGTLSLTFEEGTSAAWLHDLLKPHVSRLVVCDPRKNALLTVAVRGNALSVGSISPDEIKPFGLTLGLKR